MGLAGKAEAFSSLFAAVLILLGICGPSASYGEPTVVIVTDASTNLNFLTDRNEPRYLVSIAEEPSSEEHAADESPSSTHETVYMTDKDGRRFRCALPVVAPRGGRGEGEEGEEEGAENGAEDSQDGAMGGEGAGQRAGGDGAQGGGGSGGGGGGSGGRSTRPAGTGTGGGRKRSDVVWTRRKFEEALAPLEGACFFRVDGWWTYEFCFKKAVRQFHQEKDAISAQYVLGEYDRATSERHHAAHGLTSAAEATDERYFSHIFTNGTKCDLTSLPRETEVRFVCSHEQMNLVTSVKEPASCRYVLSFHTPLLCKHEEFRTQKEQVHEIRCTYEDGSPAMLHGHAPGSS
eukprot:jgi/Mesvir1/5693/Mv15708-RA.1